MFGRKTHPNISRAERAAEGGRFDEAVDLLDLPELAGDARAEALRAELFKPLMNRAQEHLLSGRFRECLIDLDKAARCGVYPEEVAEWRRRAAAALERFGQRERVERRAVEAAADHLARGAVTLAGAHVAGLPAEHPQKESLATEIEQRVERARRAVRDAQAAQKAEQFAAAVERVAAARQDHAASGEVLELTDQLATQLARRVRASISEGALDEVRHTLGLLVRLDAQRPETLELQRAAHWIDQSADAVRGSRFEDARRLVRKILQVADHPKWLRVVQDHLDEIDKRLSALAEGPLGLRASGPGLGGEVAGRAADTLRAGPMVRPVNATMDAPPVIASGGASRRLLLRIDGVGSFLLLRCDRVVIGRGGPVADFPIRADLSERHAEIIRAGEDYFLRGSSGVELAGRPVGETLLSHGDRIHLNKRARLTFERPSRKSPAAVLRLGDGVHSLPDVRRAILWSGPILIGTGGECHISLRTNAGPYVLMDRGGEIQLRPMPDSFEGAAARPITLGLGQAVQAGDLSLSLNVVSEAMLGGVA